MSNQEPTYHDVEEVQATPKASGNRPGGFDILADFDPTKIVGKMTPEVLQAVMEIQTGIVNKKYIQKKQNLSYISHIHATETMNTVFRWDWDYQVLKYEILGDGSALVHSEMNVWRTFFINNMEQRVSRTFREVGSHEGYRLKDTDTKEMLWDTNLEGTQSFRLWSGMSAADRVLSATSRGLLRCMMRAFNYGANLYEDPNPPMNKNMAWGELLKLGNYLRISEDVQIKNLKDKDFTKETLIDTYSEAVALFYSLRQE